MKLLPDSATGIACIYHWAKELVLIQFVFFSLVALPDAVRNNKRLKTRFAIYFCLGSSPS